MEWEHRRGNTSRCVTFLATIDDPKPGFGDGAFPNWIIDPKTGKGRTSTAPGSGWILATVMGRTRPRHVSNAEEARKYRSRGVPEEYLQPKSELGRYAIANSLVQTVSDAIIGAANKAYLEIGGDGSSARDRFLEKLSDAKTAKRTSQPKAAGKKATKFKVKDVPEDPQVTKLSQGNDAATDPAMGLRIKSPRGPDVSRSRSRKTKTAGGPTSDEFKRQKKASIKAKFTREVEQTAHLSICNRKLLEECSPAPLLGLERSNGAAGAHV